MVDISFQRRVELLVRAQACQAECAPDAPSQELALYAEFKLDESYTPKLISVRVGNSMAELRVRAGGPASAPAHARPGGGHRQPGRAHRVGAPRAHPARGREAKVRRRRRSK